MIKYDEQGRILIYIMEPEEELESLRFIEECKPQLIITRPLWDQDLSDSEIAQQNGLRGGYGFGSVYFQ
jgi:hypothetical protein